MYNSFQLTKKYVHYLLTASNGKGHGIHSPFVFNFIIKLLNDSTKYNCYDDIEERRAALRKDDTVIEVEDLGAGSAVIRSNKRLVKDIASSSLKSKKYGQLLFRIARYYKPQTIIELGTSFGITTAYLACAGTNVYTCEGAASIANIARETFAQLQLRNIHLTEGDLSQTLPTLLKRLQCIDLAFIDGNHRMGPTLQYLEELLPHCNDNSILLFDDIHWSRGMEAAWAKVKEHPAVTLTIDLFFIGLVFLSPDFKIKQHFTIRF